MSGNIMPHSITALLFCFALAGCTTEGNWYKCDSYCTFDTDLRHEETRHCAPNGLDNDQNIENLESDLFHKCLNAGGSWAGGDCELESLGDCTVGVDGDRVILPLRDFLNP